MSESILSLRKATKVFSETDHRIELFRGLDFDLKQGDFTSIVGASGVGKSTLLHILGLLEKPTEGEVIFRGNSVASFSDAKLSEIRNREIGFVFQFHHHLPDLNVLENVLLPLQIAGRVQKAGRDRARNWLVQVGLESRLNHLPSQLSGGERQRVALARALVNEPKVLLCDEPSGNLDTVNSEQLHALLADLNRNTGLALLVVTHDMALAKMASHALTLKNGALCDSASLKGL